MAETNYKRTVAGSVGAGVGALFNASGRTYYILEHKTTSKYHNAGESQKIIIDQIELGRDSSCQVRYDESFETVSRKHAAIVRDGQNWQLVNLSNSNPTLVNGQPIQGSYYLQSGDEIQLSVGGPRLGFIVPQGKQALTSSIRLTERMNLFRQQALRPYRRAIWILTTLLILAIVGFGIWNYKLHQSNEALKEELRNTEITINSINGEIEATKIQLEEAKKHPRIVNAGGGKAVKDLEEKLHKLEAEREEAEKKFNELSNKVNNSQNNDVDSTPDNLEQDPLPNSDQPVSGVTDLRDYYNNIYRIIVEEITLERGGISRSAGMALSKLDCGTGFILDNGTFVTARQNVQPWIYVNGVAPDNWRYELAQYIAMGFEVKMKFSAYSTSGPSQKIEMSDRDFDKPEESDYMSATISLDKERWEYVQGLGFSIDKKQMKETGSDIKYNAPRGHSYALYHRTGRTGIATNSGISQSISGAHDIEICGYINNDIQNLAGAAEYYKTSTSNADLKQGTIKIQDAPGEPGYLGAPAFVKDENGVYSVVGVYVGNYSIVPISKCQ